jgi:hypothetical protein
MIYLLSTQCMLDFLTGVHDMVAWMKNKPANMIEVCSVSIGQGHIEIA